MGVKRLNNGQWKAEWRDAHGGRHRHRYRTRKAADRAWREGIDAREQRLAPSFHEAARAWLKRKRKAGKQPATLEQWESHVRHLELALGERDAKRRGIDHLDPDGLDGALARLERPQGPLGPRTVAKVRVTLRAIFAEATRRYRLRWNPALHLAPVDRALTHPRVRIPSHEVPRRLLEAAEPGLERVLLLLVASKGPRHGEILALTWPQITYGTAIEPGRILIDRSVTWVRDPARPGRRLPKIKAPKTAQGVRALPLDPVLELELKRWKLECPPSATDLVFPSSRGEPMHRSTTWRLLQRVIARADLPEKVTTIHQLRHYFASALQALPPTRRPSLTDLAALMGHADAKTTLAIYAHPFVEPTPEAVSAVTDVAESLTAPTEKGNKRPTRAQARDRKRATP